MKGKNYFALIAVLSFSLLLYANAVSAQIKINNCRTITASGSYLLSRDLTAVGDCLVVRASFVSIDLNGFTISGDGTGNGVTDDSVVRSGIVVRNGSITNFNRGLRLDDSKFVQIERLILSANAFGLGVGSYSTVARNNISSNTDRGILTGCCSSVIENIVGLNGGAGMEVGVNSNVFNNAVNDNSLTGIQVTCPSNVMGNTAAGNGGDGNLSVSDSTCNTVNNVVP